MSYTEHAPKSYVDSKLALKADVVALQAVSAIATALDTRLSQLARDTYTKTQIDYLTEAIKKGRFKKVDSLPEIEEAELYVIYLVPRSDPSAQNVKDEYIVIVGDGGARSWEKVGSTDVDLSGYAKTTDVQAVRDSVNSLASDVDALQDDIESDSSRISTLENKVDNPSQVPTEDSNDLISSGGVFAALAGKLSTSGGTMERTAKITWSNNIPGASTYSISRDGIKSSSALPSSNWTKPWSDIAQTSKTVPTSRTVNGKALSSDVTLTGADIAVSGTDAAKIDAALAGKANDADVVHKSGDTMTGSLHMGDNYLKWRDGNLIYWLSTNGLYIWADGDDVTHSPNYTIEFPLASGTFARTADIPYDLGTPITIDTASSDPEGEMIYFGAATLADHTANIVQVLAPLDELRITFPAATSGKVRDFGLRVEIGTGSAALAAPALVPIAPTGETIKLENADGTIPELADGTATAKGVTLLYFSETAPGVFVVKGEQVEEVA